MNTQQFGINSLNISKAARKYLKAQRNQSAAFLAGSVYADMLEENNEYLSTFVQNERNRIAIEAFLTEKGFTEIRLGLDYLNQIITRIRIALRSNARCAENALQSVYLSDIGEIDLSTIQSPTLTIEAYSEAKNRLLNEVYKTIVEITGYEVDLPYNAKLDAIVVAMNRAWQSNNSITELETAIKNACMRASTPEQEEDGEELTEDAFDIDEDLFDSINENLFDRTNENVFEEQ